MKMLPTALATLTILGAGFGAMAPAMAEDSGPAMPLHMQQEDGSANHFNNHRPRQFGHGRGGVLAQMVNFGRDGENIEIAIVRLTHRIDLTSPQQALLDSFKTTALAAQADYAKAIETIRPNPATDKAARPNPAEMGTRLDQRIAMEQAHVKAMTAIQPAFEAFFASLTDTQKANLMPRHNQSALQQTRQDQPWSGANSAAAMPPAKG